MINHLYKIFKGLYSILLFLILIPGLNSCSEEKEITSTPSRIPQQDNDDSVEFILPEYDAPALFTIENGSIDDIVNNRQWAYQVFLPPSYNEDEEKSYPVLYMLHGLGAKLSDWQNPGLLNKCLDYLLYNQLIPEMIVVMPDAGETYYVNNYSPGIDYETFFFSGFMPEIESRYRIIKEREARAIAGFSMGGYGAVYYAFSHIGLFDYCFAMSTPFAGKGVPEVPPLLPIVLQCNPSEIPYFLIDVGIDDQFVMDNLNFHNNLTINNIYHEFSLREGFHEWKFWKESFYLCLSRLGELMINNKQPDNYPEQNPEEEPGIENPEDNPSIEDPETPEEDPVINPDQVEPSEPDKEDPSNPPSNDDDNASVPVIRG